MRLPTESATATIHPARSARALSQPAASVESGIDRQVAVYQSGVCLHELFEAQVERTPDAPCLQWGADVFTYRDVNTRANQLAQRLRRLGVGPETLVGVCLERSPALAIALYAILKAGGAYVPLDPSYPRERLEFMISDTNAPVLVTQTHLQPLISTLRPPTTDHQPPTIICLDAEWEALATESAANVASGVNENNLAYVIYTSGSTGKPKGVMTEHRGICNQLQWMQTTYPLTPDAAVLLRTPFSFDYSLYELFTPLLAGARIVVAEPAREKDPSYLLALIQREHITTLFVVPSMLHMLLAEPGFGACQSLRQVFSSGEPLPLTLQKRFFATLPPPARLINLYGPTETSIEACHWDCERDGARRFVPIGRPMGNYEIVILDEQRQVVPVGEVGELHIGGIGLARGYWNRPELTAERFISCPLSVVNCQLSVASDTDNRQPITSNRLYKTGDLARRHPDGVFECLGRMDFQVKLRGHRIELGEIEAALLTYASVRTCVVVVREDEPGDQRLVAYLVPSQLVLPAELRAHLAQTLPAYMLPAAFVSLESLPLLPNGKVDRKQLPAPSAAACKTAAEAVAPANETERRLAQMWAEALHLRSVGVTDNFFALGGHSLLAVRIFAAIEKEFGHKLPLATLLQAPTIRQLAAALTETQSWATLVPLQPAGHQPPFFCVHAVGGNVLEYYELARQMSHEQPFYGLQAVGLDGQQPPLNTIEEMAARYIAELRQLQPTGPYYLGGRSFGGVVAYEMAQQLHAQGQEVALVALLDTDPIGWRKRFSRRAALAHQAQFLRLRVQRHLQNLRGLRFGEQWQYLREKVAYKKRKLASWRWQMTRHFSAQPRLADTLREVEEFNYQAARNYVPNLYPGRVTFIYAEEEVSTPESIFGWESLALGGVEVLAVPGNHQSMIQQPHVQLLAAQLKSRLTPTKNLNPENNGHRNNEAPYTTN